MMPTCTINHISTDVKLSDLPEHHEGHIARVTLAHSKATSDVLYLLQVADTTGEFGSLMGKVQGIVWDLTHAAATIECVWDPTLHLGSLGKNKNGNAGTSTLQLSRSSTSSLMHSTDAESDWRFHCQQR